MTKLLVVAWFSIATVLIFGFNTAGKSAFDPVMRLSQAIMSTQFENQVSDTLQASLNLAKMTSELETEEIAGYIVRVTQGDCFCEWLSNRHQVNLTDWASDNKFVTLSLDINDLPQLEEFVPSTPAIIALNHNQQLIYFGPYSRGAGCFASTGEVDAFLSNYVQQNAHSQREVNTNLNSTLTVNNLSTDLQQTDIKLASVIDVDATGCYCEL